MTSHTTESSDAAESWRTRSTSQSAHRLRLLIVMAQGTAGSLPEAWRSYAGIEEARGSALQALRDPRVLHVGIVEDNIPLRLLEWVVVSIGKACGQSGQHSSS